MSTTRKTRRLSEIEKSSIKKAFEYLDTDKDGFIDYYETKAAMRALGFDIKKPQLLVVMRAHDKREENKINYEDFYYIMADKMAKRDPIEEIKYAYKLFSANSPHGKIGLTDLQKINETLGCRLNDEEMRGMIEEFDIDQDGFINEAEFIEIMSNQPM